MQIETSGCLQRRVDLAGREDIVPTRDDGGDRRNHVTESNCAKANNNSFPAENQGIELKPARSEQSNITRMRSLVLMTLIPSPFFTPPSPYSPSTFSVHIS